MEDRSERMSEQLLSHLPRPANLASYQEEMRSLFARNQEKLRQHQWTVRRVWIFVIVVSIPGLYMAGAHFNTPAGNWFLGGVLFWALFAALEVAKYEQNRGRVELLKEMKQLQLQVLELHAHIAKAGAES